VVAVAVAVAALLVGGLAACGIPEQERPRPLGTDEIPFELPGPTPVPTTAADAPGSPAVEVFLVDGNRLAAVRRSVTTQPSVDAALAAVLGGPTTAEQARGLRTAIRSGVRLAGTVASGVPLLDLGESFAQIEGEEQILALAQLVYTVTGIAGVDGVSFALLGRPVEVPTGDGTLKGGPLRREDYATVAPGG
jgi:hypothetical protein